MLSAFLHISIALSLVRVTAGSSGAHSSHQPLRPQELNLPLVEASGSRRPAGYTQQAQYSTFSCTGLKWGENNRYGQPGARTCRFDNVCLNHSTLEWQYYWPIQPEPLFYRQQDGQPQTTFPNDFVNTGHVHIANNKKLNWAPKVLQQPIPSGAAYHAAPVVAYHSANDFLSNFGHALFDFLFPVFNMLQLLGLYTPEMQIVFAQLQGENDRITNAFLTSEDDSRNLGPLISRRPLLERAALAQQGNGTLTCVHTLVAGAGSLQQTMARTRVMPFRAASFVNMGILVEPDLGANKPVITILKKSGRRMVENTDEIYQRLLQALPGCHVLLVEGDQIATMSIRDQLQLMSATSVLITPSGGLGTVLMFLQPGASAIVFNFYQDYAKHTEQQENIYYWNMEHVDLEYFPMLEEDYQNTTDRPGCENALDSEHYKAQGRLLHCNTRLRNLTRLDHVVKGTLRKWAVNHDKPMPEWVEPDPMTSMPTSLPGQSFSRPHVTAHTSSGSTAQSASSEAASLLATATADPFSQPAVQTASQSTSHSTRQSASQSAAQASGLPALKAVLQSSSQAPPQQASSNLNSKSDSSASVEPTPAQMGSGKQGLRKHRLRMRSMHHNGQQGS